MPDTSLPTGEQLDELERLHERIIEMQSLAAVDAEEIERLRDERNTLVHNLSAALCPNGPIASAIAEFDLDGMGACQIIRQMRAEIERLRDDAKTAWSSSETWEREYGLVVAGLAAALFPGMPSKEAVDQFSMAEYTADETKACKEIERLRAERDALQSRLNEALAEKIAAYAASAIRAIRAGERLVARAASMPARSGDPDGVRHRKDDPATIAEMQKGHST